MKASAIQPILFSYLANIYSTDTPVTVEAENGNGQKAGVRQTEIDYPLKIKEIILNGKSYSEKKLPKIGPKFLVSICILKSLNDKKFFNIINYVYDKVENLKKDLINLDSNSKFMEFHKQLSIFAPIIFDDGEPHRNKNIKISISPTRINIIHWNRNSNIEEFVNLVSNFSETEQLSELQNAFKSWIGSLKQEIAEFIKKSESIDKLLKNKFSPAIYKQWVVFENTYGEAKKYIFTLYFYFKLILDLCRIFDENKEKCNEFVQTFKTPYENQLYPIYIRFENVFLPATGNPQKYTSFDLEKFKETSDGFISDFSKFFESSIQLGIQHGIVELNKKKE